MSGCSSQQPEIELKEPKIEPQPPTPTPGPAPTSELVQMESYDGYMKVEEYNVRERTEFIEFMTYDKNSIYGDLLKRQSAEAKIFLFNIYDMEFYDKEIEACVQ